MKAAPAVSSMANIADVLNPDDIDIYRDLAGGVTTANILHGSANPIGGQTVVIKLRWGKAGERFAVSKARCRELNSRWAKIPSTRISPRRRACTPRYPGTRLGVEEVIRQAFIEAREYKKQWDDYNQRKAAGEQNLIPPRRDVKLDPLVEVMEGKRYVHAHCYRADEIVMLIRVANEFGFKVRTFQHVLEGYKVADEIAAAGAGGSTFSDWWAYKMEAFDAIPYNAALMTERGVVVSVNSDDAQEARQLNQEAAKSMKYGGLSANDALKLVTLNPAIQLGIDERVGSIEVGKDADLAIFNHDPLSVYAVVQKTLIDGQVYFDRQTRYRRTRRAGEEKQALLDKEKKAAETEAEEEARRKVGAEAGEKARPEKETAAGRQRQPGERRRGRRAVKTLNFSVARVRRAFCPRLWRFRAWTQTAATTSTRSKAERFSRWPDAADRKWHGHHSRRKNRRGRREHRNSAGRAGD